MSTLVKNPNVPQDQMLLQLQNGGGGNVLTSPVKASLVNGDRQSEDEEASQAYFCFSDHPVAIPRLLL